MTQSRPTRTAWQLQAEPTNQLPLVCHVTQSSENHTHWRWERQSAIKVGTKHPCISSDMCFTSWIRWILISRNNQDELVYLGSLSAFNGGSLSKELTLRRRISWDLCWIIKQGPGDPQDFTHYCTRTKSLIYWNFTHFFPVGSGFHLVRCWIRNGWEYREGLHGTGCLV